jgi:hypothetical protein
MSWTGLTSGWLQAGAAGEVHGRPAGEGEDRAVSEGETRGERALGVVGVVAGAEGWAAGAGVDPVWRTRTVSSVLVAAAGSSCGAAAASVLSRLASDAAIDWEMRDMPTRLGAAGVDESPGDPGLKVSVAPPVPGAVSRLLTIESSSVDGVQSLAQLTRAAETRANPVQEPRSGS